MYLSFVISCFSFRYSVALQLVRLSMQNKQHAKINNFFKIPSQIASITVFLNICNGRYVIYKYDTCSVYIISQNTRKFNIYAKLFTIFAKKIMHQDGALYKRVYKRSSVMTVIYLEQCSHIASILLLEAGRTNPYASPRSFSW